MTALAPVISAVVLAGLSVGVGMWILGLQLAQPGAGQHKKQAIVLRVARALRDRSDEARRLLAPAIDDPVTILGVIAHPALVSLATRVDQVFGGTQATARLLARAGRDQKPGQYRIERLGWVTGGASLSLLALTPTLIQGSPGGVLPALVALPVGAIAGAWLSDRRLHVAACQRHQELLDQFPTMVELLALTLSAGQSLPNSLERVTGQAGGALAGEWRRVLRQVELGEPLGLALRRSADDLAVPEISALVEHLVYALERGAPLADVVRAHSTDARADRLRLIIERSGKAEIAMLVPLVLLILPITVLFAVWPGLQALQMGF